MIAFLSPDRVETGGPAARSPLHREVLDAGGRFAVRDGWHVATSFGDGAAEAARCRQTVGFADRSALGKLEVHAGAGLLSVLAQAQLRAGEATRVPDGWWCPLTRERALLVVEPAATARHRERLERSADAAAGPASVVELTTGLAALAVVGPAARETFARLTALDLRPSVSPPGALRPGSVARVPGIIICEAADRFLLLFGAAHGRYVWTALSDAVQRLGGGPVGVEALA